MQQNEGLLKDNEDLRLRLHMVHSHSTDNLSAPSMAKRSLQAESTPTLEERASLELQLPELKALSGFFKGKSYFTNSVKDSLQANLKFVLNANTEAEVPRTSSFLNSKSLTTLKARQITLCIFTS